MNSIITIERIEQKIITFRKQKVILDRDLALLYEVETRNLNQAVKRNIDRFPEDFMFQLTEQEFLSWKSQIVISNSELRELSLTHKELSLKLEEMENKYDKKFRIIFQAINRLLTPPKEKKREIGFKLEKH